MEKITKQQEFINNDNDEILNETVINGRYTIQYTISTQTYQRNIDIHIQNR